MEAAGPPPLTGASTMGVAALRLLSATLAHTPRVPSATAAGVAGCGVFDPSEASASQASALGRGLGTRRVAKLTNTLQESRGLQGPREPTPLTRRAQRGCWGAGFSRPSVPRARTPDARLRFLEHLRPKAVVVTLFISSSQTFRGIRKRVRTRGEGAAPPGPARPPDAGHWLITPCAQRRPGTKE